MWAAAQEIARREGITIDEICNTVNANRAGSSLTSSVRVYILDYYWQLARRLEGQDADHDPV